MPKNFRPLSFNGVANKSHRVWVISAELSSEAPASAPCPWQQTHLSPEAKEVFMKKIKFAAQSGKQQWDLILAGDGRKSSLRRGIEDSLATDPADLINLYMFYEKSPRLEDAAETKLFDATGQAPHTYFVKPGMGRNQFVCKARDDKFQSSGYAPAAFLNIPAQQVTDITRVNVAEKARLWGAAPGDLAGPPAKWPDPSRVPWVFSEIVTQQAWGSLLGSLSAHAIIDLTPSVELASHCMAHDIVYNGVAPTKEMAQFLEGLLDKFALK